MNKQRPFTNLMAVVLVFLLGSVSGTAAQKTSALVRSDELTREQRLRWREALEWPTHCENGIYQWDDEDHPRPKFLDVGDDRYLVYNICDMGAYQRGVNVFLVETNRPAVKLQLLTFKVLEPVYNPNPNPNLNPDFDLGDVINAPLEERIQYALEEQEKVEYEARMTSLIWGAGFFMDDQGRLVVDRRSSGPGTCGTYSTYDLDYDPPKLVGFRADATCLGSSDVSTWKSYSQEYIDQVPLVKSVDWDEERTPTSDLQGNP